MTEIIVGPIETNQVIVNEQTNTVIVQASTAAITTLIAEGPQGPAGLAEGNLPTGGNAGNILIKDTSANYDASWTATLDGGTFN